MRRYQLVLGGTVAGTAAVLAFPTHHTGLQIPTAAASTTVDPATTPTTTTDPGSATSGPSGSATSTTTPATTTSTTRSATSTSEQFRYGDISVKVTVSGSRVTAVTVASLDAADRRSQQIDAYSLPELEQQVISAGSVHIDGVSGATFTSQAFVDAVDNALTKLGISS